MRRELAWKEMDLMLKNTKEMYPMIYWFKECRQTCVWSTQEIRTIGHAEFYSIWWLRWTNSRQHSTTPQKDPVIYLPPTEARHAPNWNSWMKRKCTSFDFFIPRTASMWLLTTNHKYWHQLSVRQVHLFQSISIARINLLLLPNRFPFVQFRELESSLNQ